MRRAISAGAWACSWLKASKKSKLSQLRVGRLAGIVGWPFGMGLLRMGRRKNVPVLLNRTRKVAGRCGAGNKRCLAGEEKVTQRLPIEGN